MKIDYFPDTNSMKIVFDDGKESITVTEKKTMEFNIINNSSMPTDENLISFVSLLFLEKKQEAMKSK